MKITKKIAPALFDNIQPAIIQWLGNNYTKQVIVEFSSTSVIIVTCREYKIILMKDEDGETNINVTELLSTIFTHWFFVYSSEKIDPYMEEKYTIFSGKSSDYQHITNVDQYYNYMLEKINEHHHSIDYLPGVKEFLIKIQKSDKTIPIYGAQNPDSLDADINREIWHHKREKLMKVWEEYEKYQLTHKVVADHRVKHRRFGTPLPAEYYFIGCSVYVHKMNLENVKVDYANLMPRWDIQHRYTHFRLHQNQLLNDIKYIERRDNNSDIGFKYCETFEDFKSGDGARFYADMEDNSLYLALY